MDEKRQPTEEAPPPNEFGELQQESLEAWIKVQPPALRTRKFAEVVAKALISPQFRKQLVKDPESIFDGTGIDLNGDVKIKVLDHSEDTLYLLLPDPVPGDAKVVLKDEDMTSGEKALFSWNDDVNWYSPADSKRNDGRYGPGTHDLRDLYIVRDANVTAGNPDTRDP